MAQGGTHWWRSRLGGPGSRQAVVRSSYLFVLHIYFIFYFILIFFRSVSAPPAPLRPYFDRNIAFGESGRNWRLVVLGLKVMDRLALDDVKSKDSGEAQVAESALIRPKPSGCIPIVSATYTPVLGIGQLES